MEQPKAGEMQSAQASSDAKQEPAERKKKPSRRSRKGSKKGSKAAKVTDVSEVITVIAAMRELVVAANKAQQDTLALSSPQRDIGKQPRFGSSSVSPKNLSAQFNAAICTSPQPSIPLQSSAEVDVRHMEERAIMTNVSPSHVHAGPEFFAAAGGSTEQKGSDSAMKRSFRESDIQKVMHTNTLFIPTPPIKTRRSASLSNDVRVNKDVVRPMDTNPLFTPARR